MTRASRNHDFSDADVDTDADPSPLRQLVLAQFHEPGGAAVQLLTTATLAGSDPYGPPEFVARTARDLGLDLDAVELFSADAYLLQSTLGEAAFRIQAEGRLPLDGSPLIALNYHDVPAENRLAVRERITRLRDLGEPFDPGADVDSASGPRVLVGFYDAYREAGLFGAELCDELGIGALFFPVFEEGDEPGCAGLTDEELRDIARRHELGFHTASHARCDEVGPDRLEHEVIEVLDRLAELAGRPPRLAAWRGGTRFDSTLLGDKTLQERGVSFVMSNWGVERVPPRHAHEP